MLLDYTYDISHQEIISERHSRFEAIAPDGLPRLIDWYSLNDHHEELKFNRYRQVLRKLKHAKLAQVDKVVSRPGTHYVVWFPAPEERTKPQLKQLTLFEQQLLSHGVNVATVEVAQVRGQLQVLHLPFDEDAVVDEDTVAEILGTQTGQIQAEVSQTQAALPPRQRPSWGWLGYWLPGISLIAMSMMLVALSFRQMDRVITLPTNLIGQNINEASALLIDQGFTIRQQALTSIQNNDVAEVGEVVEVIPAEGTALRRGHTVTLAYRAVQSLVPELTGLSLSTALDQLERGSVRLGTIARIYSSQAEGTVLAQSPSAMTPREPQEEVSLLVSLGPTPELSYLPDLVGLRAEEAIHIAADAGITWRSESYSSDATVLGQSIPPYRPFNPEEVVLRLSFAEPDALERDLDQLTPNLLGMDEFSARRAAAESGLTILDVNYIESANLVSGVIQQSPSPSSLKGEDLRLTINRFQPDLSLENPETLGTGGTDSIEAVAEPVSDSQTNIVEALETRLFEFAWTIQPGIGQIEAEVIAEAADGQRFSVVTASVQGGDIFRYEWQAAIAPPVRFSLLLGGNAYGEAIITEGEPLR